VLAIAERLLAEAANLKRAGEEFANETLGTFTLAATHTQARYALPKAVAAFKRRYPDVQIVIHQGNPTQICEQVASGEADVCVATEAIAEHPALVALPCYQWNRCVVVPARHPLARSEPLTLEAIARFPIVTYDFAYANRSLVNRAFEQRGLKPNVVLTAFDADVIKTYVELGLGIGIIAAMAFDEKRDRGLRSLEAGHLFGTMTTRVAVRRGAAVRAYTYTFIELFSPRLTRRLIETALAGKADAYEL
jgi:LysR family cys regulon transcriptional activator